MISRLSRSAAPAILTSALVALSACGGSTVPSMPSSSQNTVVGAHVALEQAALMNAQPNTSCPSRFYACGKVSKKKGLEAIWCYGPKSNPCSKSNVAKVKWSGIVCLAAGKTCKNPIKELTGAMTGPYKCKASDKCHGTWELDTITPGPGLKETNKYLYKQDVSICRSPCQTLLIGLDVGP
jgi:hypothetical protein